VDGNQGGHAAPAADPGATPADPSRMLDQVLLSARRTAAAVGELAESELALARAALLRAVLLAAVASACTASAAILGLLLLCSLLVELGLAWPTALAISTLAALVCAALLFRRARRLLDLCAMPASRRQLAALFGASSHPASAAANAEERP